MYSIKGDVMGSNDQKFIVKEKKANREEFAIKKAPSKTLAGKILIVLIVIGTILVPIVAMIVSLFQ